MSVIELDHATICFRDRTVLSDVSFSIDAGEFVGVLGPNGAGKTTLMKALLGLIAPSQGADSRAWFAAAARQCSNQLCAAGTHLGAGRADARFGRGRELAEGRTVGHPGRRARGSPHGRGCLGGDGSPRTGRPGVMRDVRRRTAAFAAGASADRHPPPRPTR